MQIKTFIINAFTSEPFKGNPAGVCLMETAVDDHILQSIASELNLSETAFLYQNAHDDEEYAIRYFTPTVEIDFCGHATLASAKLVLDQLGKEQVEFTTRTNLRVSANSEEAYIKMVFPIYETTDYPPNKALLYAFGIDKAISSKYCSTLDMLLIEVEDKANLLAISPDFQKAMDSSSMIKEVVITTKSEDDNYDFYSRCFCPWIGIDEDPVTGASHSVLAKYWGDKLHQKEMSAY